MCDGRFSPGCVTASTYLGLFFHPPFLESSHDLNQQNYQKNHTQDPFTAEWACVPKNTPLVSEPVSARGARAHFEPVC